MTESPAALPLADRIRVNQGRLQEAIKDNPLWKQVQPNTRSSAERAVIRAAAATNMDELRRVLEAQVYGHSHDTINPNARWIMRSDIGTPLSVVDNPSLITDRQIQTAHEVAVGKGLHTQIQELTEVQDVPFYDVQQRAAIVMAELNMVVTGSIGTSRQTLHERLRAVRKLSSSGMAVLVPRPRTDVFIDTMDAILDKQTALER